MTHEQFTQIYLPFSGKMYALAYNLLRNRDEARDCVQDVYAELGKTCYNVQLSRITWQQRFEEWRNGWLNHEVW